MRSTRSVTRKVYPMRHGEPLREHQTHSVVAQIQTRPSTQEFHSRSFWLIASLPGGITDWVLVVTCGFGGMPSGINPKSLHIVGQVAVSQSIQAGSNDQLLIICQVES